MEHFIPRGERQAGARIACEIRRGFQGFRAEMLRHYCPIERAAQRDGVEHTRARDKIKAVKPLADGINCKRRKSGPIVGPSIACLPFMSPPRHRRHIRGCVTRRPPPDLGGNAEILCSRVRDEESSATHAPPAPSLSLSPTRSR